MILKRLSVLFGLAALLPATAAIAGKAVPPPTVTTAGSASHTINRGYAGLKWTLGKGAMPAAVIGFRQARVRSNGDTDGGDISFSFNLAGGFVADKLRVKYFDGKEDLQGEVGAGYDFAKGFFAGVGAQAPHVNPGVDYLFSAGAPWEPYVIVNTLKKYDKPNPGTTSSCPSGYTFNPKTGNCDYSYGVD